MWVIFALLDPDPYPDPLNRLNPDPIRIRIRIQPISIHHWNPACYVRRPEPAVRDTDQEGLRLRRVFPCDQQQRLDNSAGRAGSARGTGLYELAGVSPYIPLVLVTFLEGHRFPLPPIGVGSITMQI